jgi:phage terminase Nu1 subunit (DNA packaging protein)
MTANPIETLAACLARSSVFMARWLAEFGDAEVETRQVHRLPGCPATMLKGQVMRNRQRLAQALRLLADSGRAVLIGHGVGRIERAGRDDAGRCLWRLTTP